MSYKMKKEKILLIALFVLVLLMVVTIIIVGCKTPEEKTNETIEEPPPEIIEINESKLEWLIYQKINEERIKEGIDIVNYSNNFSILAKEHSQDMLKNDYVSVINLENKSAIERALDKGWNTYILCYGWRIYISEFVDNISIRYDEICGSTEDEEEISDCAIKKWIYNPDINEIILGKAHFEGQKCIHPRELGVGVSCDNYSCLIAVNGL